MKSEKICYKSADGQHHPMGNTIQWASDRYLYVANIYGFHITLNCRFRGFRELAGDRCGYCRSLQKYVLGKLEIEHLIPTALGARNDEDNLWLACCPCNNYKGTQNHCRDS